MPLIRFADVTVDVTVTVPDGSYKLGGKHDDLLKISDASPMCLFPNLRNGVAKDGWCSVIVADQTAYTRALSVLQGLRSAIGVGKYTVYIDGTAQSYKALVDVSVVSEDCQHVEITWRGTINTTEG
jgi:hypothetical protein